MELYDILICIEPFKYPHTGDRIRNTIISKITSLDSEVNQDVLNSSVDQGPSNLNLSDLTLDNKIGETAIYIPLKIIRTINECNTRWGSFLASWKHLKELKDSIKHIIFKLFLETSKEAKKDYEILKKWFLKYWEWDLLDCLLELFKPIEKATEWLGGQKYCMLSLIYPTIQVLKYNYIVVEEEIDEDSVLLASILDSRFKKMKGWPEEDKERAIALLRLEYAYIKDEESLNNLLAGTKLFTKNIQKLKEDFALPGDSIEKKGNPKH
ncbi:42623_t:CDS:2, partial [Gigaspora margarita]